MKTRSRFLATPVVVVSVCFLSISGCGYFFGSATNSVPSAFRGDNAFRIGFQRAPDEALSDFRDHLESNNLKVLSVNGDTLRTDPGDMYGGLAPGLGQEIRLIAVAEETGNGSAIVVKAEYLDPGSGEWKDANSKGSVLAADHGENRPHYQAYMGVNRLLLTRYGTKAVKYVRSDLQY